MTSLDETQIADLVAMVAARTSVPDPSELRLRVARRQRLRRAAFAGSIFLALLIASTAVFGGSAEEEVELADVGSPPAAGETGSPEINPLSDCAGVLEASGDWTDEMLALCERLFGSNARSTAAVISEAQSELLNDLSFAGYETAFANFRSCLQRGGVALQITSEPTRERPLWTYQFPDTQGASLIHDACYEWHFELVDSSWQATLAANTIPDGLAVSCAGIVGAAPGVDSRALRLCNRTIARVYGLEGANAGDLLLSSAQDNALVDNAISAQEYEEAFKNLVECASESGVAIVVEHGPPDERAFDYSYISSPTSDVFFGACYEWHFIAVDQTWQTQG